jgi:hypothetical protein
MQHTQLKTLDTGRRVQGFLDDQASLIGDLVRTKLRQELDDAVAKFAAFQLEQGTAHRAASIQTVLLTASRRNLYELYLRRIRAIAQLKVREVPELQTFVVPVGQLRNGEFLERAEAAAVSAATFEQLLIDGGMPGTFLPEMNGAIAELRDMVSQRNNHLVRRSAATAGIDQVGRAIRDIVKVLDTILSPALKSDSSALAGWKAARRFHQTAVTPLPGGAVAPDQGESDNDEPGKADESVAA